MPSNTMVRVGKSLPASSAFSRTTLLHKLDCMQFNCIQSFSGCSARGLLERGQGGAERVQRVMLVKKVYIVLLVLLVLIVLLVLKNLTTNN